MKTKIVVLGATSVAAFVAFACSSSSSSSGGAGSAPTISCDQTGAIVNGKSCPNDPKSQGMLDACNACLSKSQAFANCVQGVDPGNFACGADGKAQPTTDAIKTKCAAEYKANEDCYTASLAGGGTQDAGGTGDTDSGDMTADDAGGD